MTIDEFMMPQDGNGKRTCSACKKLKSVEEFYKDGKTSDGEPKYRRDCRICYNKQRAKTKEPPPRGRKRK